MRARIAELGGTPLPGSPADFAKLFRGRNRGDAYRPSAPAALNSPNDAFLTKFRTQRPSHICEMPRCRAVLPPRGLGGAARCCAATMEEEF
jgi:hypothetical protein